MDANQFFFSVWTSIGRNKICFLKNLSFETWNDDGDKRRRRWRRCRRQSRPVYFSQKPNCLRFSQALGQTFSQPGPALTWSFEVEADATRATPCWLSQTDKKNPAGVHLLSHRFKSESSEATPTSRCQTDLEADAMTKGADGNSRCWC